MDTMIKEINDNLKTILDTIRENRDNSISTLDNIQNQMDKKVEEAKKYKIQVDSAKDRIRDLENENKSLEVSLKELNDKYGKMNLVSIIEAGNREIKTKMNDNFRDINKEKEHIQELTNKARTIKDLLINLKKDKSVKEEKLENIKVIYEYYNDRINDIVEYAYQHSNNLQDYKREVVKENDVNLDNVEEIKNIDLDNTMVFDEIANIDENKNFKDEMSFINDEINDNTVEEKNNSVINNIKDVPLNEEVHDGVSLEKDKNVNDEENVVDKDKEDIKNNDVDFDKQYNDIFSEPINYNLEKENDGSKEDVELENSIQGDIVDNSENNKPEESTIENNEVKEHKEPNLDLGKNEEHKELNLDKKNNTIEDLLSRDNNIFEEKEEDNVENDERINKINDLFSSINTVPVNAPKVPIKPQVITGVEEKIDNAYKDIFGEEISEKDLNKKEPTLTDIFGNPIKNEDLSESVKISKKLEDLFSENGIDFNKFREDEKTYLKQIYDEDKFKNILETLKRNKINLDNVYHAFNIFGEMSANELENMISKLINVGQSVEAIGLVLEKIPKVKKYNLDGAINSYGDYVKDIDITELIMKAKELYKNGGNV